MKQLYSETPLSMRTTARDRRQSDERTAFEGLGSVVYFLLHFGHVKIGYSEHLRNRLIDLGCVPSDVLYVLAGGRKLEQQMHQRFAHQRAQGPGLGVEHFEYGGDLLDYMNDQLQEIGLPAL
tara:strand:+ start:3274 stop:3639 length:366 start_codon:yes stop_codon:yes gene_type:complete